MPECKALAVLQPQEQVTTAEASLVPEKTESSISALEVSASKVGLAELYSPCARVKQKMLDSTSLRE